MRLTVGFLTTGLAAAEGGKNKGIAFGVGVTLTATFLGAWVIVFLTVVEPLWASIMI